MLPIAVSPLATIAIVVVSFAALFGGGYLKGRQDGREAMLAEQLRAASKFVKRQDKVTERVRIEYRDRVQVVREKAEEVIRDVERLVPAGGCQLPGGWRVLHDSAADGALAGAADGIHGPPAPVEATAAAETVAGNYLTCHENSEQLRALQAWVQQQHNLKP